MLLCNSLIYENRMTCATSSVANAQFTLLSLFNKATFSLTSEYKDCSDYWLQQSLSSTQSVVYLNTDVVVQYIVSQRINSTVGADITMESDNRGDIRNTSCTSSNQSNSDVRLLNNIEIETIRRIVKALISSEYELSNVGIISPYKTQVNAIKNMLKSTYTSEANMFQSTDNNESSNIRSTDTKEYRQFESVYTSASNSVRHLIGNNFAHKVSESKLKCEVSTVDKFQGQDMELVIFSTVRSCQDSNVGLTLLMSDFI